MSILAYTGLPGAGKSYAVTEHQILPALRAGRRVVTNVPLAWDRVRTEFPSAEAVELPLSAIQAEPEKIYDYVTPGSVLVLDEVWRIFPAGLKANQVPEPYRKLLAEHRHMVDAAGNSTQVVLVTQDLAQVAAFARQLVEQTFRTTKLSSVGLRAGYRLDVFNGPVAGPNPSLQSRIREIYGRYHKGVWQYYSSHTMSESAAGAGANEKAVDRRGSLLKSPAVIIAAVVVVGGALFVLPRAVSLLQKDGMSGLAGGSTRLAPEAQAASTPGEVVAPAIVPVVAGAAPAPAAVTWRLAAVVINHEEPARSRAVVTDGVRTETLPYERDCYAIPDGRIYCRYQGAELVQYGMVSKGLDRRRSF